MVYVDLDKRGISGTGILKCLNVDQKWFKGRSMVGLKKKQCCCWMKFRYISTLKKQSSDQWTLVFQLRIQKSSGKVLASVFWVFQRLIMIDFLGKSRTISRKYYSMVLTIPLEKIVEIDVESCSKVLCFFRTMLTSVSWLRVRITPLVHKIRTLSTIISVPTKEKFKKEVMEAVAAWFAEQNKSSRV